MIGRGVAVKRERYPGLWFEQAVASLIQRLREEEWTWGKVRSSVWGPLTREHWWDIWKEVSMSVPGLQPHGCPLCPPGCSPSWLGAFACAVCSLMSSSLPTEQISASVSFHRVALPTRPFILSRDLTVFLHYGSVFFILFLWVMTWLMPGLPLQPVSSIRTGITSFLFLYPQSLEHSEKGLGWQRGLGVVHDQMVQMVLLLPGEWMSARGSVRA